MPAAVRAAAARRRGATWYRTLISDGPDAGTAPRRIGLENFEDAGQGQRVHGARGPSGAHLDLVRHPDAGVGVTGVGGSQSPEFGMLGDTTFDYPDSNTSCS